MSTNTTDSDTDDTDVFERLYEEYREELDDLAGSDNPAAPLAEMVREEARGDEDA
jgi:hypothetical protein